MRKLFFLFSLFVFSAQGKTVWVNPENKKDPRCDAETGHVKATITTDTSMEFRSFKVPQWRATFTDRQGVVLATDVAFSRAAIWLEGGDVEKVKKRFEADKVKLAELLKRDLRLAKLPLAVFEERRGSPIVFNQQLSEDDVAAIKKANLPRIRAIESSHRHYPLGAVFSHAVGWVMREESLTENYLFPTIRGRAGLESILNEEAAGKSGLIEVLRDSTNFEVKMILETAGVPAQLIELGLDSKLQSKVFESVSSEIKNGVVLVADTQTGEVPVMLSLPVFDPNIFNPFTKNTEFDKCAADDEEPLANKIYRNYKRIVLDDFSKCLKRPEDFQDFLREASYDYAKLMDIQGFIADESTVTPLFLLTLLQRMTESAPITFLKNKASPLGKVEESASCEGLKGTARRRGSFYLNGESIGLIKNASYYLGTTKNKQFNIVIFVEDSQINEKALLRIKKKIEKALI